MHDDAFVEAGTRERGDARRRDRRELGLEHDRELADVGREHDLCGASQERADLRRWLRFAVRSIAGRDGLAESAKRLEGPLAHDGVRVADVAWTLAAGRQPLPQAA